MTDLSVLPWQEFFLRTLTLHWLSAIAVVLMVALMIATVRSLNATTRHNIWLLTLASFIAMPLLIFVPRPVIDLPQFMVSNASEEMPGTTEMPVDRPAAGDAVVSLEVPQTRAQPVTVSTTFIGGSTVVGDQDPMALVIRGVLVCWLAGVLFLFRRLWGEYRAARELELQSDSATPYFERRFDQLCARLGINERPPLRFHAGINAPMTVGIVSVWVAIPMAWRETIDDRVFDQTLTHEIGHIARKDPLIHTLQRILSVVFWMYPAVWYVTRQLEIERESACDDWVLTHDDKSATYAANLLDVAESLYLQPQVLAVGCLRSHSQLRKRVQNLLNKSSDHKVHSSWPLLVLISVGLMATLSVSAVAWPEARQLAPPVVAKSPVAPAPLRISAVPENGSRVKAASAPPKPPLPSQVNVPASEPVAAPEAIRAWAQTMPLAAPVPEPLSIAAAKTQKTVSITEGLHGKPTIERFRNGVTNVIAAPYDAMSSARYENAEKSGTKTSYRDQLSGNSEKDRMQSGSGLQIVRWPVRSSRISLAFGDSSRRQSEGRKAHEAIDFPMKEGSSIHAVAAGYVEESDYSVAYGNYVILDHGNGYKTRYANNSVNTVEKGDYVNAQQKIAEVGNTSRDSTGPHLHFEVSFGNVRIDPESVFVPKK